VAQQRIEMLPETPAAPNHVFPQARLALVHAGRGARPKRRTFVARIDALFVKRVAGFVQGREQRFAEIVVLDARGYAHVAGAELGTKGVMRLVEAAAVEVVAEALDRHHAEL